MITQKTAINYDYVYSMSEGSVYFTSWGEAILPLAEHDWLKWSHDNFETNDLLFDHDTCNSSVWHACTSVVTTSVLASSAVSSLSAHCISV